MRLHEFQRTAFLERPELIQHYIFEHRPLLADDIQLILHMGFPRLVLSLERETIGQRSVILSRRFLPQTQVLAIAKQCPSPDGVLACVHDIVLRAIVRCLAIMSEMICDLTPTRKCDILSLYMGAASAIHCRVRLTLRMMAGKLVQ